MGSLGCFRPEAELSALMNNLAALFWSRTVLCRRINNRRENLYGGSAMRWAIYLRQMLSPSGKDAGLSSVMPLFYLVCFHAAKETVWPELDQLPVLPHCL